MKKFFIFLVFVVGVISVEAQNIDRKIKEQEQRIAELKQRITQGEAEIVELKRGRASAEETLEHLARQVEARNLLLDETQKQARRLAVDVSRADSTARGLGKTLTQQKQQYAATVREAYRNYAQGGYLTYVFSAGDAQRAMQRVATLREVAALRERQMQRITTLSVEVDEHRADLKTRQRALDSVQKSLTAQRASLQRDVDDARARISQLSTREREALQAKQMREKDLNSAVSELRRLSRENRTGASFTDKTKGLRIPVAGGRVVRYRNNMAEVAGPKDAAVTAIYEGRVVDVKRNRITGKYDVYVAHGQYISSYANLNSATVAKNDVVSRNERIGIIGSGVNVMTMQPEYTMIFGIYAPKPEVNLTAANFFKP